MMPYRGRRKVYVFYEERFFVYHRCESIAISTILTCVLDDFCTVCTVYHKIATYIQLRTLPLSRCQQRPESAQAKVRRPFSALNLHISHP